MQKQNVELTLIAKIIRYSFAHPSLFLRTKVGAKSVDNRSFIEFGTEEERRESEGRVEL